MQKEEGYGINTYQEWMTQSYEKGKRQPNKHERGALVGRGRGGVTACTIVVIEQDSSNQEVKEEDELT